MQVFIKTKIVNLSAFQAIASLVKFIVIPHNMSRMNFINVILAIEGVLRAYSQIGSHRRLARKT